MASKSAKAAKVGFEILSEDNREWMKALEASGWIFTFEEGQWATFKAENELGPFDSFMVMMNMVEQTERKTAAGDGTVIAEVDAKGRPYLPEMGEVVVKELVDAAKTYEEVKRARMKLTAEEKEKKDDLINISHKYKEHFTEDESGDLVYHAAGITIIRTIEEVEKIKTKLDGTDEEDS